MIGKLKVLAVALAAVFAMSAVAASGASAQTQFHSELTETVLTGTQNPTTKDKFTTTAGSVECEVATYKGTVKAKTVTEVTVAPTYGNPHCTVLGLTGIIHTNECVYRAKIDPGNTNVTTGTVDVVCPPGKEITATAGGVGGLQLKCTIHVPSQNNLGTVTFSNSGKKVHLAINIAKLKYTHTKGEGVGACPSGSSETGTYVGTALFTGESTGGVETTIFVG